MSERSTYQPLEATVQKSEAYQQIDLLTNEVVFDQEQMRLQTELTENPELKAYGELSEINLQATRDMYAAARRGDHDGSSEFEEKAEEADAQMKTMPIEVSRTYDDLKRQLDSIREPYRRRLVASGSFEADVIMGIVNGASRPQYTETADAPLKDYKTNTLEAWQYMPDEQVQEYLGRKVFFDTDRRLLGVSKTPQILIETKADEVLEIPLDLIVKAEGFDSWLGRHGYGKDVSGPYASDYHGKIRSLDVIKHYASLPSELPPVDTIDLFIQPDGLIFGDNSSGDSHRIAAAILRGDKTIKADRVSICCLERNWLTSADIPSNTPKHASEFSPAEQQLSEEQWGNAFMLMEQIHFNTDLAERTKDVSNLKATDLVAMITLLHNALAPLADQNPTPGRMHVQSPDGSDRRGLMNPEERYAFLERATELIHDLAKQVKPGEEASFLARR